MNNYPNFKNYTKENMQSMNMYDMNTMSMYPFNVVTMNYDVDSKLNSNMYSKTNSGSSNFLDQDSSKLYDPFNGLIRGNLFKNLYEPYKSKEPYEIKPMNEQAELLTYIDALGFAMIDLNLYLDIYPDNKNMINLFNQYRKEKESMLKEYEAKFGPITLNSDALSSYPWSWDDMPWPWDN